MPWFDTLANAPAVITEYANERDFYWRIVLGEGTITATRYYRTVGTTTTEHRGLTYAAAKAAADTEAGVGTQASVRRENSAGGYTLIKTEVTQGEWQEDT